MDKIISQKTADNNRTTMQISMSAEDKRRIKIIAARRGTTAAALVHEWIEQAWSKEDGEISR